MSHAHSLFSTSSTKKVYFLPSDAPLRLLPNDSELHRELNQLVQHIPEWIQTKILRKTIDSIDSSFSHAVLKVKNQQERQTAILILAMLAQSYIWEDINHPATVIPFVIGYNLYHLCQLEQRVPTLIYADYILHNWKLINPTLGMTLDNVEPLFTLTGSIGEKWFIKIHVVIEAIFENAVYAADQAEKIAQVMLDDLTYVAHQVQLIHWLHAIAISCKDALDVMRQMKKKLDPTYFFDSYRNFLNGWDKVRIITGSSISLAGVCDTKIKEDYIGPSGAQSSVLPKLDASLGIQHTSKTFFKKYMPMDHVKLIETSQHSKIKQVIDAAKVEKLTAAYQLARSSMMAFRTQHYAGLVETYIFKPAAQKGLSRSKIEGTGGTVEEFLLRQLEETACPIVSKL